MTVLVFGFESSLAAAGGGEHRRKTGLKKAVVGNKGRVKKIWEKSI